MAYQGEPFMLQIRQDSEIYEVKVPLFPSMRFNFLDCKSKPDKTLYQRRVVEAPISRLFKGCGPAWAFSNIQANLPYSSLKSNVNVNLDNKRIQVTRVRKMLDVACCTCSGDRRVTITTANNGLTCAA